MSALKEKLAAKIPAMREEVRALIKAHALSIVFTKSTKRTPTALGDRMLWRTDFLRY